MKNSFPIPVIRAETLIPHGEYCYTYNDCGKFKVCPFWDVTEDKIGLCSYLHLRDGDEKGTFLLFDQVKECGIKQSMDFEKF